MSHATCFINRTLPKKKEGGEQEEGEDRERKKDEVRKK